MSGPCLSDFAEKEFYLDEFRGRTLLFMVPGPALHQGPHILVQVASELVGNGTRLILLFGGLTGEQAKLVREIAVESLRSWTGGKAAGGAQSVELSFAPSLESLVKKAWTILRETPVFAATLGGEAAPLTEFAGELGSRLKVHKLVILDPGGGIKGRTGRLLSLTDAASLGERLAQRGGASLSQRGLLLAAKSVVEAGVASASICSLEGLSGELFSYQGTGTLCTAEDYCQVARVGIDDYREVEKFIKRGQEEGFLKPRSDEEIAELLPNTWGATVGTHRLAGVCALEIYDEEGERVGEVAALCTVSRFKGEGIGSSLLAEIVMEARKERLKYIFACTTSRPAVDFFVSHGFRVVRATELPLAKWRDYDSSRQQKVTALRREL